MIIISRDGWNARPARPGVLFTPMHYRTEFIVHHSDGPADQSVRAIQDWCMDGRGFKDIDYNFLIRGTSGEIYEGRGWTAVGSHCRGHNISGVGVCIIGVDELSTAAKTALRGLYATATAMAGHPLTIRGHRDCGLTTCPGDPIYTWIDTPGALEFLRDLALTDPLMRGDDVRRIQHIVGAVEDGIYGPLTKVAVQVWQRTHGLADDGIVGPLTRAKMGID